MGNTVSDQGRRQGATPQTWAIIVWALYLASSVTGFSGVVGLIIAYIKRSDLAATPFGSHMTYAIRTFWIGLLGFVISLALIVAWVGALLLIPVFFWTVYREIRGLVCAIDGRPISNPQGWL
jgi:uncharacterized membrane protein